ncbi:MAG: hypothetical protein FWF44_07105, partial [Defluviitaleaceae bacterium]|nr:hypothetical protein [Defluviitaleaceae bacterium]
IDHFVSYIQNCPAGKQRGASGLDGAIEVLETRKRLELKIIAQLPIQSAVIENPDYDWDKVWEKIEAYLRILS